MGGRWRDPPIQEGKGRLCLLPALTEAGVSPAEATVPTLPESPETLLTLCKDLSECGFASQSTPRRRFAPRDPFSKPRLCFSPCCHPAPRACVVGSKGLSLETACENHRCWGQGPPVGTEVCRSDVRGQGRGSLEWPPSKACSLRPLTGSCRDTPHPSRGPHASP